MLFCTSRAKSPRMRAGGGLHRVGGAGQRAERLDRPRALDHQGHQRAAGDELDQRAEERALAVLGVVRLGGVAVQGAQLGGHQRRPLRSSRVITSPTRPRATPSGLTRTRVRSVTGRQPTGCRSGAPTDAYVARRVRRRGDRRTGPNGEPSRSLRSCEQVEPDQHEGAAEEPHDAVEQAGQQQRHLQDGADDHALGTALQPRGQDQHEGQREQEPQPAAGEARAVLRDPPRDEQHDDALDEQHRGPGAAERPAARTGSGAVTPAARRAGCGPPPP